MYKSLNVKVATKEENSVENWKLKKLTWNQNNLISYFFFIFSISFYLNTLID